MCVVCSFTSVSSLSALAKVPVDWSSAAVSQVVQNTFFGDVTLCTLLAWFFVIRVVDAALPWCVVLARFIYHLVENMLRFLGFRWMIAFVHCLFRCGVFCFPP